VKLRMSKVSELQAKAAKIPEETAAEVLDFLESITERSRKDGSGVSASRSVRGSFRGRLRSSERFAAAKQDEIALEK